MCRRFVGFLSRVFDSATERVILLTFLGVISVGDSGARVIVVDRFVVYYSANCRNYEFPSSKVL